jgi:hypothetical protein
MREFKDAISGMDHRRDEDEDEFPVLDTSRKS